MSLDIAAGEIHALLGENGAGKSTLVKILYGAVRPDAGEIRWDGAPVVVENPAAARRLGVGMVFQHFSLFEGLTVAENIALAVPGSDAARDHDRVAKLAERYGLALDPKALVADLSAGERQRVEIVRCLLQDPRLLILDEPTSVLTPQEAETLFASLNRLAGEGRAVLYISHKLEEVRRLCQRATILRHGEVVATCDPRDKTPGELAAMMVGADVAAVRAETAAAPAGAPMLKVAGLSLPSATPYGKSLKDVSLDAFPGEVRAIAGIAGEGQSELFEALSGERLAPAAATIEIDGRPVGRLGVVARRRLGAAFVSEERLGHGAAPLQSLTEAVVLTRARAEAGLMRVGFLDYGAARRIKDRIVAAFDVRKSADDPPARALSGGNLQKFLVGREVDRRPRLLIVNQPSWGVDAGAAAQLRQTMIDMARGGAAVLVISQDLDEIFEIADRVAVIADGRLSPFRPIAEASRESIGLLMAGRADDAAPDKKASADAA